MMCLTSVQQLQLFASQFNIRKMAHTLSLDDLAESQLRATIAGAAPRRIATRARDVSIEDGSPQK